MKKITRVVYVADDGKEFIDKQECYEYESEKKKIKSLKRALRAIRGYCSQHENCNECPFKYAGSCGLISSADYEKLPCNWKIESWGED